MKTKERYVLFLALFTVPFLCITAQAQLSTNADFLADTGLNYKTCLLTPVSLPVENDTFVADAFNIGSGTVVVGVVKRKALSLEEFRKSVKSGRAVGKARKAIKTAFAYDITKDEPSRLFAFATDKGFQKIIRAYKSKKLLPSSAGKFVTIYGAIENSKGSVIYNEIEKNKHGTFFSEDHRAVISTQFGNDILGILTAKASFVIANDKTYTGGDCRIAAHDAGIYDSMNSPTISIGGR